jgi:hypothetical protein
MLASIQKVPPAPANGEYLPCPATAGMEDDKATWQSHYQVCLEGPDVWQFRWSEKGTNGKRIYRKRGIGTIEEHPNEDAAQSAVASLITEVNWANLRSTSITMTVAQLCSHFEQRELARSNTWRSYSTKMCYAVYLRRWILPNWGKAGTSQRKDYRIRILATAVALGER